MNELLFIVGAVILGLGGSIHCLGMCGPLFLMAKSNSKNSIHIALYLLGKSIAYSTITIPFLFIKQIFVQFQFQQFFALIVGLLLLFAVVTFTLKKHFSIHFIPIQKISQKISVLFNNSLTKKGILLFGFLNGLLPCGLVVVAMSASLLAPNHFLSIVYMFIFGLSTAPALFLVVFFRNKIYAFKKLQLNKILPILFIATSSLIVLRGMNLGIPFISPKLVKNQSIDCCKK